MGVVAAGVAAPLVRRRLRLPAPAVIGQRRRRAGRAVRRRAPLAGARRGAPACCRCGPTSPPTRCPTTTPSGCSSACGSTTRSWPTPSSGLGTPPRCASSATRTRAPSRTREKVLVWAHWVWFLVPHGSVAYILAPPPRALPARGRAALRDLRPRRDLLLGASRPRRRGTPRSTAGCAPAPTGRTWSQVRRMMVEYGEQFWKDGWQPPLQFPCRKSARRHAFAALRDLRDGRAPAGRDRTRRRGGRVDLCAHARSRARLPRRALPGRPARGPRAHRGHSPRARRGPRRRCAPSSRGVQALEARAQG